MERIAAISDVDEVCGYYAYTADIDGVDATTRMFAPSFGIPEESATGMAAGLLSGYLYHRAGIRKKHLIFDQGVYMSPASPSRLTARLAIESGTITNVWVGGRARTKHTISIVV